MGNVSSLVKKRFNSLFSHLFGSGRRGSLSIIGLDAAGKTSLINMLKGEKGEHAKTHTLPTLGFNMEEVDICGTKVKIWDLGGQKEYISYWSEYVKTIDGLVFVIDVADEERYSTAFAAFEGVVPFLKDELPVLFLLNKIDLTRDKELLEKRVEAVKKLFERETRSAGVNSCIQVGGKTFKDRFALISVKNDMNMLLDTNSNWTPQDSSVYPGFKWLLDEMKNSEYMTNRN